MFPRFSFALLSLAPLALAAPPAAPTHLRVNDVASPVGTGADVYFGWLAHDPDPNEIQTRHQIRVASSAAALAAGVPDVWDSGEVASRAQNHVAFPAPEPLRSDRRALRSDQRYFWQVRTWDKDGQPGPWSTPARFDVGLLADEDWSGAAWIRRENKDADDYTHFRKTAALPASPVVRATAYVSAVHHYELHLNGALVGKGQAYHHPQYQYYRAFDVTDLLRPGADNQLAVLTHWFGGGQGRPASARGLLLKLVAHHADGSVSVIGTDATWKQSRARAWVLDELTHRNRGEGVGFVEHIDARLLQPDWTTLAHDDSAWEPVTVLGPHPTAPWTGPLAPELTRIEENTIGPASIADKGDGKYVVDLGKVHAGMPRIRFSGGAPGAVVTMRGGFELDARGEIPPGTKAQSTLLEYRATLDGGTFTYAPIEYLGFRFFQIDNAPMPVTTDNFSFVVRHSRLDADASAFASADPALDAAWRLMKHSLFTCAQEGFVDTPTREKGGFLGDSVIQSTVAMPVLAERALTRRTLREFLQSMEQHWSSPEDRGRMNAVYPNNDGGRDIPDFTQAYLPWVWNHHLETGDRAFLASAYSKLQDIGDHVHRHTDPATGLVTRLTGGKGAYEFGIIDWPATMRHGHDMSVAASTVINGWAIADYLILASVADTLDRPEDRDRWLGRAKALRSAMNARLLGPDGVYIDGLAADGTPSPHASQHANLFPLALGIAPAKHRAAVIEQVKSKGMSVGMVTVSWLIRALGESDQGPTLLDLFTRPEQPGWARTLARGGTATWESWDADETGQSLSHAWGAAGLEAHVRYVLGIRPLAPQYEQVLVQPLDFGERLPWAKGRIATDRGEIAVDWKRVPGGHEVRVKLPVNVTARVGVPAGSAPAPTLLLDGAPTEAERIGAYLYVSGVGSGEHVLARRD